MRDRIFLKLRGELKIDNLEVTDNSHLHPGHLPDQDSETHFKVVIRSEELANLGRVAAHRLVNQILKEELKKIHALEIKILK